MSLNNGGLIGNYSQRDLMTPSMLKTPMMSSKIKQEAYNALLYKNAQTPLLGGQNVYEQVEVLGTNDIHTPNVLKRALVTPIRESIEDGQMLPPAKRQKINNVQTPVRDEMKINKEGDLIMQNVWEQSSL